MAEISKSFQIALGGLITALSIILMFMTGFVPFGEILFPTLAGLVLIACVCEMGPKPAFLVYLASAFLSVIVCPVKESAMIYTIVLGYYPILHPKLEKIKPLPLRMAVKFSIFNVTIFLGYYILIKMFGLVLFEAGTPMIQTVLAVTAVLANIFFAAYDFAVKVGYFFYPNVFRKKYLKRT